MYIIHVASELAPIAKVGGLADVVYGLSKQLCRLGHRVEIVLPKYSCINDLKLQSSVIDQQTYLCGYYENLKIILFEDKTLFEKGAIYGHPNDIERFAYFCKAASLYVLDKKPDVVHVHDWPTSLVPLLIQKKANRPKTVLTIHNISHQGRCKPQSVHCIPLPERNGTLVGSILADPYDPSLFNLLKAGITCADRVVAVSPNYEREILTPLGGHGLHLFLQKHREKLFGILNGIDVDFWNPEIDPYLFSNYPAGGSKESFDQVLEGKKENKKVLISQLGLRASKGPLVSVVSRLVPQKSPELIKYGLKRAVQLGGQFVLLGSAPNRELGQEFERLQKEYRQSQDVAILLESDEAMAHRIFAAADLNLIPSLFEPCGLTQMISLRYGTIPIARMTGGLVDTVFDMDTSERPQRERNGFTFEFADHQGLDWALSRAFKMFERSQAKWHQLMMQAMAQDVSWTVATLEYIKIYQ